MKKLCHLILLFSLNCFAQPKKITTAPIADKPKEIIDASLLSGLKFRSIGPSITSGRIVDLVVNPNNVYEWYIASAAGGVWKTKNAGTTFEPIFDSEASFTIGCITMDPNNENVLWVGSGENNNQRAAAYGDGLYKTENGGKTWKNVGLKNSEHIGKIAVNPKNSDEVFVASYGPLWSSGGDRGIYKTTDGGATWKQVLKVSEHTGFNEVHIDPNHTNIIYATAHQRQRKVYTYVGGGSESALYKSTDGGNTWNKIMSGLPTGDIGRIGLAMSPINTDVLFAMVESREGAGVYKSNNRGASWEKQSSYATSGNYYVELTCDPKDINRLYSADVFYMHSLDAGKTWSMLGEKSKHVDNHVIWINPKNTDHKLVGCDGGLYETFDDASTWYFKENIPVTQFYRVGLDNASPFYNVYGGTQDNFSLGGPSRTTSGNGIANSDWFITNGGDGFESVIDPTDPNIVYAESQYGGLVRYDKKSGEILGIQPQEAAGEAANRWNWDAPIFISHHNHKRIYFGSQKLYRSNDRGESWKILNPDLSRNIDRNKLEIMGKVWPVDAVAKNGSTDIFGQLTSISESKFDENIIITGSDDGQISITNDGGNSWSKTTAIAGIPDMSYIYFVHASLHNKNTFYVVFNSHRYGDFKPYMVKSTDGGKTWLTIQANLPERGSVYCIAEDHVNANLLFCGTEFGVFATLDGGAKWTQLKGGLPAAVAVRDMEIQRRENDLVLATFGRGFYVLDDYSALRELANDKSIASKVAHIFKVKDALMFIPNLPLGIRGKGFLGESHFATPNPEPSAVFTYHLKESIKTIKEKRTEAEKEKIKNNLPPYYPSLDSLRMEDEQVAPHLLFTITNAEGNVVRRIKTSASKGLKRLSWDFRHPAFSPVSLQAFDANDPRFIFGNPDAGYMVVPGTYKVSLHKFEDAQYTELVAPQSFNCVPLNNASLAATDKQALDAFSKKLAALQVNVSTVVNFYNEINAKMPLLKQVIFQSNVDLGLSNKIYSIDKQLKQVAIDLNGDATKARREFETLPGLNGRVGNIVGTLWSTTTAPNGNMINNMTAAQITYDKVVAELKQIETAIKTVEAELKKIGAPYTPGRGL